MSSPNPPPEPRRPASAMLTPLALVLFIASLSALAASVLLMVVAQRVANRPSPVATARADSLGRELKALRAQLAAAGERPVDAIGRDEIAELKRRGLADPVADLKADLGRHPELIPFPGVAGGTMGFYSVDEIHVLDGRWVYARFEDGHVGGGALFGYTVEDGRITWKRIAAALDE